MIETPEPAPEPSDTTGELPAYLSQLYFESALTIRLCKEARQQCKQQREAINIQRERLKQLEKRQREWELEQLKESEQLKSLLMAE